MSTEGYIDSNIPDAGKVVKTWYKVYGELGSNSLTRPLVLIHGGPAVPSTCLAPLAEALWIRHQVPTIIYDQFGCGKSTRFPEKLGDTAFWTPNKDDMSSLFQQELQSLVNHLGIEEDYDILGHSWGGMLAFDFIASRRPTGVKHLILASAPASIELFLASNRKLLAELPQDVQDSITKHERDGTYEDPEYQEAMMVFYNRHLCRQDPWPETLHKALIEEMGSDPTAYQTMFGPSEFTVTGPLKEWTALPGLQAKDLHYKTLVTNGAYDEVQPEVVQPFVDNIKDVKWVTFGDSAHISHLEELEKYVKVVLEFLRS